MSLSFIAASEALNTAHTHSFQRQLHCADRQVSDVAEGPVRRAASGPLCCTQWWTLSVTNCIVTVVGRTKLSTLATVAVPWRNFSVSPNFGTTFQRELSSFWRYPISLTTHAIFTSFSVHVAYGRGSVLLRQGDEIPRGKSSFGGFSH